MLGRCKKYYGYEKRKLKQETVFDDFLSMPFCKTTTRKENIKYT